MYKNVSENYARENGKKLLNVNFDAEFVRICVFLSWRSRV
jgi:hypothetical protein